MGQWQWGNWSNGNDRSLPLRSIDRVCVCVCVCGRGAWGALVGVLFDVLIEKVSECQMEVRIKGVTYLFDYFD
jgi:hypothetical protein